MVKNMQEMLLLGAGITTNVFKPGDTEIMVVMSSIYEKDVQAVIDFFEIEQAKYVDHVYVVDPNHMKANFQ